MKIKIIFFGSSSYPIPLLDSLLKDEEIEISLLITSPDKTVGRKKLRIQNPVKLWAIKNHINYLTFNSLKNNQSEIIGLLKTIKPDLGLVGYYGLYIPKEIYEIPKHQTLNIHFSLLPKYRGPAPLQHAIINGDKETGITLLKISQEFDAGGIVYQEKFLLSGNDTPDNLYKTLFQRSALIIPEIIKKYIKGLIKPYSQNTASITYAPKIDTEDAKINWSKMPKEIERLIRVVNPNPGAWTEIKINGIIKRLKILSSHLEKEELIIDEVQLEGKTPVSFKQFKNAYPKFTF